MQAVALASLDHSSAMNRLKRSPIAMYMPTYLSAGPAAFALDVDTLAAAWANNFERWLPMWSPRRRR